jgi:integrase
MNSDVTIHSTPSKAHAIGAESTQSVGWICYGDALGAAIAPGRIIHGARHNAGTEAARRGSLRLAKELLGHAGIKLTMRYAHVLEADPRNQDFLNRGSEVRVLYGTPRFSLYYSV